MAVLICSKKYALQGTGRLKKALKIKQDFITHIGLPFQINQPNKATSTSWAAAFRPSSKLPILLLLCEAQASGLWQRWPLSPWPLVSNNYVPVPYWAHIDAPINFCMWKPRSDHLKMSLMLMIQAHCLAKKEISRSIPPPSILFFSNKWTYNDIIYDCTDHIIKFSNIPKLFILKIWTYD